MECGTHTYTDTDTDTNTFVRISQVSMECKAVLARATHFFKTTKRSYVRGIIVRAAVQVRSRVEKSWLLARAKRKHSTTKISNGNAARYRGKRFWRSEIGTRPNATRRVNQRATYATSTAFVPERTKTKVLFDKRAMIFLYERIQSYFARERMYRFV